MITVVSGLPRSGTSLMMQMLRDGGMEILTDGDREPDESNPRGYLEYEPVKHTLRDASWVADGEGKAVKVVAPLLPYLPGDREYRVLFMTRDLDEVLASQTAMLARMGAGEQVRRGGIAEAFEAMAGRALAWSRTTPGVTLLEVPYGDIIGDPGHWSTTVAEFVGGGLNASKMVSAVDPSLYRQRC